jgi:hypothetical protein
MEEMRMNFLVGHKVRLRSGRIEEIREIEGNKDSLFLLRGRRGFSWMIDGSFGLGGQLNEHDIVEILPKETGKEKAKESLEKETSPKNPIKLRVGGTYYTREYVSVEIISVNYRHLHIFGGESWVYEGRETISGKIGKYLENGRALQDGFESDLVMEKLFVSDLEKRLSRLEENLRGEVQKKKKYRIKFHRSWDDLYCDVLVEDISEIPLSVYGWSITSVEEVKC